AVNLDWARLTAQTEATRLEFEVASVKPHKADDRTFGIMGEPGGRFRATNASPQMLIRTAFQLQDDQIVGGPAWLAADRYDIVAKAPEGTPLGPPPGQGPGAMQLMLRSLLAERMKLVTHKETRELPIYALVLADRGGKRGPNLHDAAIDCAAAP